jgi:hypothetical protein
MLQTRKPKSLRDIAEQMQPVFEANRWQWAGLGIPTVDDIERMLSKLSLQAAKDIFASTGRLYAYSGPCGIEVGIVFSTNIAGDWF